MLKNRKYDINFVVLYKLPETDKLFVYIIIRKFISQISKEIIEGISKCGDTVTHNMTNRMYLGLEE